MKNVKAVVVVVVASALGLSGCASNMLDSMQDGVNEQMAQAQTVHGLLQDPQNTAEDGTLRVNATVVQVTVESVELRDTKARGVLDGFGVIGSVAADAIDSDSEGEVVEVNKYRLLTADGTSFVVGQPQSDDYPDNFKEGDNVLYVSTKPVTEGGNTFYIQAQ